MAHIIKAPVTLNSGIVIPTDCYVVHDAYFDKIKTQGIIPLAFSFYRDKAAENTSLKPVIPIIEDKEFVNIKMRFNQDIFLSRSDKYISNYISSYFRNIFGYWNIQDEEFEKFYTIQNINSNRSLVGVEDKYELVAVKVTNTSSFDIVINIGTEISSSDVLSFVNIKANSTEDLRFLKDWDGDKVLYINSISWTNISLDIDVNLQLV